MITLALVGGLAVGLVHFALAARTLPLWLEGKTALAAVLQIARVIVTAAILVVVARGGLGPLVAAFAGFLAARAVALRRRLP